jgi:hypothetical protein
MGALSACAHQPSWNTIVAGQTPLSELAVPAGAALLTGWPPVPALLLLEQAVAVSAATVMAATTPSGLTDLSRRMTLLFFRVE